jgi:hypothetical protein
MPAVLEGIFQGKLDLPVVRGSVGSGGATPVHRPKFVEPPPGNPKFG